jgi:hypothetical protein
LPQYYSVIVDYGSSGSLSCKNIIEAHKSIVLDTHESIIDTNEGSVDAHKSIAVTNIECGILYFAVKFKKSRVWMLDAAQAMQNLLYMNITLIFLCSALTRRSLDSLNILRFCMKD